MEAPTLPRDLPFEAPGRNMARFEPPGEWVDTSPPLPRTPRSHERSNRSAEPATGPVCGAGRMLINHGAELDGQAELDGLGSDLKIPYTPDPYSTGEQIERGSE